MNEQDEVRLIADVTGDDGQRVIPAGTVGVVVDVYRDGAAYAVDVELDGQPDNVYVTAQQVEPVEANA
jgi:hypothetical protein